MNKYISLAIFIIVVLGGGILIGTFFLPGEWYAALAKPPFNPPNWLFGPVWSVLYVLIAIAGWLEWQRDRTNGAMKIWFVQLAANFLWSPTFFDAQQIGLALVVIAITLISILAFIGMTWSRNRAASLLFVPYAVWVAFATALNASIWWLNG